jgi:nucleotide-binding universal stress UspA family protein
MKVLVAVDGSAFSRMAVEALGVLNSHPPEVVSLIHVIESQPLKVLSGTRPAHGKRALAAMEKAGTALLRDMEKVAQMALPQAVTGPHTKIQQKLLHGPLAATIVRQATLQRADLVILGTRGLSDAPGFLLGSVSRKVAGSCGRACLVVKQPLHALKQVVLAVDGSKFSRSAALFLRDRLLPEEATVTILSVAEPVVTELAANLLSARDLQQLGQPALEQAQHVVETFRDLFMKEGFYVKTEVCSGRASDTILDYLTTNPADLLVVGSRGLVGTERLQLGSVSETLLKYVSCAFLLVRGGHA